MKIVVLVKEVPDTYGDRRLDLETGLAERSASERVRSVDAAVSFKEANDGVEVIVLSMGPESVTAALRKSLAMGADNAVHVLDDELIGADVGLTAEVLSAAVRKLDGVDVVLAGNQSTDGTGGVVPAMVAEHLGWPQMTFLSSWELTGSGVSGVRVTDGGNATVSAGLPVVVSVTEAFPDPRFPNFKGIMAAKKKPLQTWSLTDVGVNAAPTVPRSIVTALGERPPREAGVKVVDEGDAGEKLAAFLTENRLV